MVDQSPEEVVDAAAASPPATSPPSSAAAPRTGPDMGLGMGRAMVAMQLFEKAKLQYGALDGVAGEAEYDRAIEEVHRGVAKECLAMAQSHGGIYNKAAQFVASLQGGAGDTGIPKPYIEALSVLTDKVGGCKLRPKDHISPPSCLASVASSAASASSSPRLSLAAPAAAPGRPLASLDVAFKTCLQIQRAPLQRGAVQGVRGDGRVLLGGVRGVRARGVQKHRRDPHRGGVAGAGAPRGDARGRGGGGQDPVPVGEHPRPLT